MILHKDKSLFSDLLFDAFVEDGMIYINCNPQVLNYFKQNHNDVEKDDVSLTSFYFVCGFMSYFTSSKKEEYYLCDSYASSFFIEEYYEYLEAWYMAKLKFVPIDINIQIEHEYSTQERMEILDKYQKGVNARFLKYVQAMEKNYNHKHHNTYLQNLQDIENLKNRLTPKTFY